LPSEARIEFLPDGLGEELERLGVGSGRAERVRSRLVDIHILKPDWKLFLYRDQARWERGGAETYVAVALVIGGREDEMHERTFVAKALVPFGTSVEAAVQSWVRTRAHIQSIGIRVPAIYHSDAGTIYEEYIEKPFGPDWFESTPLLQEIGSICARLDAHGYETLSVLGDLRRKDDTVYCVDFGFDLGKPTNVRSTRALEEISAKIPQPFRQTCLDSYHRNAAL
jgi:hypothetical protein